MSITDEPRRQEFPVVIDGKKHVVIARENNDGEVFAYVYVLTEAQNNKIKRGGAWVSPTIALNDGEAEHVHGKGWPFASTFYYSDLTAKQKTQYEKLRNETWNAALEDAKRQVENFTLEKPFESLSERHSLELLIGHMTFMEYTRIKNKIRAAAEDTNDQRALRLLTKMDQAYNNWHGSNSF